MTPAPYPPGPRGPFSGLRNLLALRRDPPGFFLHLARTHGGAASFRLLGRRFYFFSDPEAVREVLVARASAMRKGFLVKRVWTMLVQVMGNGLLTSEGAFHDRQRRLIVPVFHRERLAGYAAIMTDAARAQSAPWADGDRRDLAAELSHLTLTVVARSLFGADLGVGAGAISEAMTTLMGLVEKTRTPLAILPWSDAMRQYRRAKRTLDTTVAAIIAARRAEGGIDHGDLLSMLLLAHDEDTGGPGMSDRQVHDEVMTLLLAGHETTAGALAWTFHLLGQNPDAEARLHAELDPLLPDARPPTLADLPRLVYTRQVFTEAMRLFPPAWVLARQATEAVEVGGWTLPAGSMCLLSPYATHHDARWFPDPGRFRPERWSDDDDTAAATPRPKHAYFPFGGGPRSCAAENFAWMEGTLVLADLARRWQFRPAPGQRAARAPGRRDAAPPPRPADGVPPAARAQPRTITVVIALATPISTSRLTARA